MLTFIVGFVLGAFVGFLLTAVLSANDDRR